MIQIKVTRPAAKNNCCRLDGSDNLNCCHKVLRLGIRCRKPLSRARRRAKKKYSPVPIYSEIVVATPAPTTPISGAPRLPNINTQDRKSVV